MVGKLVSFWGAAYFQVLLQLVSGSVTAMKFTEASKIPSVSIPEDLPVHGFDLDEEVDGVMDGTGANLRRSTPRSALCIGIGQICLSFLPF